LDFTSAQGDTATTKKTTAKSTAKSTNTGNNNDNSASITASGSDAKSTGDSKSTGKSTGDDDKKTTAKSEYKTTKTFDARLPAGGVSMITPDPMAGAQYYKIGKDYVTLAWNFTSLKVTPSAVDVLASCSLNSATYTIALNQSITGNAQSVTWDTGEFQASATIPLVVATYTLIIYDAASDVTSMPRAGYLGVYDQFTFGMYTPQAYTPMSDYVCATCNGAMSSMERHTLGFMFGMVAVTVLSFGWFAGVAGLW